jgi:nitrite reductase (NADH) large subunit
VVGPGPVAEAVARAAAARRIEVKYFGVLEMPIDGVEIIRDHAILEILGESDVRAVRLTNQKVLGASLIIFASGTEPNLDIAKGTDLAVGRGIVVDEMMRTNIPEIFAAGGCAEVAGADPVDNWEAAVAQGHIAGENLCRI